MTSPGTTSRPAGYSGLAVGVTVTAGVILILAGVCHVMVGIVGLVNNEFYVATQKWVFQFDSTTWGWIHIVVGLIAVLTGVGLLSGALWARVVGVIVAAVSIVGNFLWLPYYPWWAALIIAFDLFVIWALTAHGRDVHAVNVA
ncbi:MAG TPA: hypothetical protein VII33_12770 [Nakamurella sp.]|jgi:hypothetical protein